MRVKAISDRLIFLKKESACLSRSDVNTGGFVLIWCPLIIMMSIAGSISNTRRGYYYSWGNGSALSD